MQSTHILATRDWKKSSKNMPFCDEVADALAEVHAATSIYDRFDKLINLIRECEKYKNANGDNDQAKHLQKSAILFAAAIVDAKNPEELQEKISKRNQYKHIDPTYMPWPVPVTKLDVTQFSDRKSYEKAAELHNKKMQREGRIHEIDNKEYKEDIKLGVKYLTETEREKYRIFISNGKFKKIFHDEDDNLVLENFDTATYRAHDLNGQAIFVVAPNGEIFAGSTKNNQFYHSSFLAGGPAFFSGVMGVVVGELKYLDNYSGHYALNGEHKNEVQVLTFFRKHNLLNSILGFNLFNKYGEPNANKKNFLEFYSLQNFDIETEKTYKELDIVSKYYLNKGMTDEEQVSFTEKLQKTNLTKAKTLKEVENILEETYKQTPLLESKKMQSKQAKELYTRQKVELFTKYTEKFEGLEDLKLAFLKDVQKLLKPKQAIEEIESIFKKTYLQCVNKLVEQYVNKFTEEKDKKAYWENAKKLVAPTGSVTDIINALKQAYMQTANNCLTDRMKKYIIQTTDQFTKDVLEDNVEQFAQSFIEASAQSPAVKFTQLSSAIFTTLDTIQTSADFIKKQAAKCGFAKDDAEVFTANFVKQVMNAVMVGQKTDKALANAIFDTKLVMAVELHAIAYRKSHGDESQDQVMMDFRNAARVFAENTRSNNEGKLSDNEIIALSIGPAKYFAETKINLMRLLQAEMDELQSFANQQHLTQIQDEAGRLITYLQRKITNISLNEKIVPLEQLKKNCDDLLKLIKEKKKFLIAKDELTQMLRNEISYMSSTSKSEVEKLVTSLKAANNLEAVKDVASEMLKTPVIIKNKGTFGAFFNNPIKHKLSEFINKHNKHPVVSHQATPN